MLLAGGVAGVVGWLATFPLDVVKTRIQGSSAAAPEPSHATATHAPPAHPYRTMLSTITHSYRSEGPGVFFRGLAPTLIR
jgi:solute carrier family 25 carnitine/acylcarnitine transporter 20/29